MDSLDQEIFSRLIDLEIECPECECIGDDQYQCGTCGGGGIGGIINVLQYLKQHPLILNNVKDE